MPTIRVVLKSIDTDGRIITKRYTNAKAYVNPTTNLLQVYRRHDPSVEDQEMLAEFHADTSYSQNIQTASFTVLAPQPERTMLLLAIAPPPHQSDTALTINRPVSSKMSLQRSPTISSRRSTSSAVIPKGGWM